MLLWSRLNAGVVVVEWVEVFVAPPSPQYTVPPSLMFPSPLAGVEDLDSAVNMDLIGVFVTIFKY